MNRRADTTAHIARMEVIVEDLRQERDDVERQASILALPWIITSATLSKARDEVQSTLPLLRRAARLNAALAVTEGALEALKMLHKEKP